MLEFQAAAGAEHHEDDERKSEASERPGIQIPYGQVHLMSLPGKAHAGLVQGIRSKNCADVTLPLPDNTKASSCAKPSA